MQVDSTRCDVLLVGYEDLENLGLRYIASFLNAHGIAASIEPCGKHLTQNVGARIVRENPGMVGFSLIYQGMLPDFAALITRLRKSGIRAHFTIGGHFPTIEPEAILELIPGLDTVIRHEGEETMLELFKHLHEPRSWSEIGGIAYRRHGKIEVTAPRPLITNLDSLPFPERPEPLQTYRGLGTCSVSASRGCYYDCSFCSIQEFYSEPPGPRRRSRSPPNVAREMKQLFARGARIFRFNDDDFGMKGPSQQRWIEAFANELERNGLAGRILWRISCRVDEVDATQLQRLKDVGLRFLYLGIESGCDEGLNTCNKHCDVTDVYRALNVLEDAGMKFEYGFMLSIQIAPLHRSTPILLS